MKKAALLLTFFLFAGNLFAQSLQGSLWLGTKPPSPNLWFNFGNDTLSYSMGTGVYTPLSIFTSVNGQLSIRDLTGTAACTDTGFYTYSISGNQLSFTLISDNCVSRRNTLTTYNWTLLQMTGLNENQGQLSCSHFVSDNGDCFIRSKESAQASLFDVNGRLVQRMSIEPGDNRIDWKAAPAGLYVVQITSGTHSQPLRIIH